MLVLADQVTLWAPSGRELAYARAQGSPITEKAFLDLVESRHLRVLARDWWYDDKARRESHPYPGARWSQKLDRDLATMRARDANLAVSDRRVATFATEAGPKWAKRQLASGTGAVERARERLAGRSWRLPLGIRDSARRADGEEGRLLAVLRDVKNHQEAFELSGAHMPVAPSLHAEAVPDILAQRSPRTRAVEEAEISAERLVETLQLLKALRKRRPSSTRSFVRMLRSEELASVRREIGAFLIADDKPVVTSLARQVAAGLPTRNATLSQMVPRALREESYEDPLALARTTVALVGSSFAPHAIVSSLLGRAGGILRGVSVLPAKDYTGPVWPFFVDVRRARYKSVQRLLAELDEMTLPPI